MDYLARAVQLSAQTAAVRRKLHQMPEVGRNLPETTAFIARQLRNAGCEPVPIDGGIYTVLGGRDRGKTILLRADMDALPTAEASGLPFAAANGCSHSCGHDCHAAILLCAAQMLKEQEASLKGCVKLVFQSDEEGLTGAKAMCQAGILENPRVDAAAALHVIPNLIPPGIVAVGSGAMAAASDIYRISLHGEGGHGSVTPSGPNVIDAAISLAGKLKRISAEKCWDEMRAALTVGAIHCGDAPNSIPSSASISGTIRTYHSSARQNILEKMELLLQDVEQETQCQTQFEILGNTPVCINHEGLTAQFQDFLNESCADWKAAHPVMGSEDFAEYAQRVPAVYFMLGAGFTDGTSLHVQHDPRVRFNEAALPHGAACLAGFAHWWLEKESEER